MTQLIENIPPYARNWVKSFMDTRVRNGYNGISEKNINEINRWLERKIKILRHMTNLPVEAVEVILLSQINLMSFEEVISDLKRWSYRNAIEDHDVDFFKDFQFDTEEVCKTNIGIWYKIYTPEGVIFEDKNSDMLNKIFLFYENGNNIYVLRDDHFKTLMIVILNQDNDQIIFTSDHREKIILSHPQSEYEVFVLSPEKIEYLNVLLSHFKVKTGLMNAFSNIVYIGTDEVQAYNTEDLPKHVKSSKEIILSYSNIKNLNIKKIDTDLIINNCYKLTNISDLSSDKNVFILDCEKLESISDIKSGEHLLIHLCNNLKNISGTIRAERDCYITSSSDMEMNIDANFEIDGDLVIQSKNLKKLKGKIKARNLFLPNCINLEEISAEISVDGIIDFTECVNLKRLPQSQSTYWRLPYGMISKSIQDANRIFYNSLINTMNESFREFKKNIIKSNDVIVPIIHLDATQCISIEEYKIFQHSLDELLEISQIFTERDLIKQGLLKIMRVSPSIIYAFHHMNSNNMIEVLKHVGLIETSYEKEK